MIGAPPSDHEARVEVLRSLADLVGCHFAWTAELPDGRRPDVLRCDGSPGGLAFFGEAKATEAPSCVATQERLERYAAWMALHVRTGSPGLLVLCHGRPAHDRGWILALHQVVADVTPSPRVGHAPLAPDLRLVWCAWLGTGTTGASRMLRTAAGSAILPWLGDP